MASTDCSGREVATLASADDAFGSARAAKTPVLGRCRNIEEVAGD